MILTEAAKVTHIDHFEDLPVLYGAKGMATAVQLLKDITMGGGGRRFVLDNSAVKFDGAPSIVAGRNPDNGQFFVSTKSAHAKTPKLAYTQRDVAQMFGHSQDLATKMAEALAYLKNLGFDRVYQGEFLFSSGTKEIKNIDGIDYVTFKPQLITYAVPLKTELGQTINRATVGFVWHTEYSGETFADLHQHQGAEISHLKSSPNVWQVGNIETDLARIFNPADTKSKTIIDQLETVNVAPLEKLISDRDLQAYLYAYTNALNDQGRTLAQSTLKEFADWVKAKETKAALKKIETAKTDRGRESAKQTAIDRITRFVDHLNVNKAGFEQAKKLNGMLTKVKTQIYKKVHEFGGIKAFLDMTKHGGAIELFSHEGISVATKEGDLVKFIDRPEFSRINRMLPKDFK